MVGSDPEAGEGGGGGDMGWMGRRGWKAGYNIWPSMPSRLQASHGYPAAGSSFCQDIGAALWWIGLGFQHAECIRASTLVS